MPIGIDTNLGYIGILSPPFVTEDLQPPGTVSSHERAALRAYLKSVPELAEITEVYWYQTGTRNVAYPLIVINGIRKDRTLVSKDTGYDEWDVQVTVLAFDGTQAEDLGEAAWNALRPLDGNAKLRFPGGYEMNRIPDTRYGPDEQAGEGPGGRDVWRYHFDVRITIGRDN